MRLPHQRTPRPARLTTSGGFTHGGWHLRYFEERSMQWVAENVSRAGESVAKLKREGGDLLLIGSTELVLRSSRTILSMSSG